MPSAVASLAPARAPGRARDDGAAIVRIAALKKTFGDLERSASCRSTSAMGSF